MQSCHYFQGVGEGCFAKSTKHKASANYKDGVVVAVVNDFTSSQLGFVGSDCWFLCRWRITVH